MGNTATPQVQSRSPRARSPSRREPPTTRYAPRRQEAPRSFKRRVAVEVVAAPARSQRRSQAAAAPARRPSRPSRAKAPPQPSSKLTARSPARTRSPAAAPARVTFIDRSEAFENSASPRRSPARPSVEAEVPTRRPARMPSTSSAREVTAEPQARILRSSYTRCDSEWNDARQAAPAAPPVRVSRARSASPVRAPAASELRSMAPPPSRGLETPQVERLSRRDYASPSLAAPMTARLRLAALDAAAEAEKAEPQMIGPSTTREIRRMATTEIPAHDTPASPLSLAPVTQKMSFAAPLPPIPRAAASRGTTSSAAERPADMLWSYLNA